MPANADISVVNSIPVLHTRLENAQRTLNKAWLPVVSKYSPILTKIIRIAHNNDTHSPIMGCRTVLSQSDLVKSGHFAVFVLNLRYHLAQYSKDCGKCGVQKLKKYSSNLHSTLTGVLNPNIPHFLSTYRSIFWAHYS